MKQHDYAVELEKALDNKIASDVQGIVSEMVEKVEVNTLDVNKRDTPTPPERGAEEPITTMEFSPSETNVNYEIKFIMLSMKKITNLSKPPKEVERTLSEILRSLTEVLSFLSQGIQN